MQGGLAVLPAQETEEQDLLAGLLASQQGKACASALFDLQRHWTGYAGDREITRDTEIVARALDLGALEGDRRILLDVEEVGRTKMRVTFLITSVEARRVDGHVDLRRGRVVVLDCDRAVHIPEMTANRRDHEMLDRKLRLGVGGIDLPRGGSDIRRDSGGHGASSG